MDELLEQIENTRAAVDAADYNQDYRRVVMVSAAFDEVRKLCDMAEKELTAASAMIHDLKEEKLDLCWQYLEKEEEVVNAILSNEEAHRAIVACWVGRTMWATRPSVRIQVMKALLKKGILIEPYFITTAISKLTRKLEGDNGKA